MIASVHDAAPEINLDGETGFNVDLRRPQELVDRLIYLMGNRDAAAAMGRVGQKRWYENFRYGAFRERFRAALWEYLQ